MIEKVQRDPKTFAIIGAGIEVHKQLGCGFLDAVYQEALAIEFAKRGIPFKREVQLPIRYKDVTLQTGYRVDFVCFDSIPVEVKALDRLSGVEEAQVLNYMKASEFEIGLLINFGARSLQHRRFIRSKAASAP